MSYKFKYCSAGVGIILILDKNKIEIKNSLFTVDGLMNTFDAGFSNYMLENIATAAILALQNRRTRNDNE